MKFCLVSASTVYFQALLMRYVPGSLLLFKIQIFSSVHSLYWSVSIVFIAEIGSVLCSTLNPISARSSCLDGFLFFGRMLL